MLRKNARIAVVAPAGPPNLDSLAQGEELVRSLGYTPVRLPHVEQVHRFNAGKPEERLADLRRALESSEFDAVWFARGGYGTIHCLPHLSLDNLDNRPIIGCSDATALLTALQKKGRKNLIHGPMLETIATRLDQESQTQIQHILDGKPTSPIAATHFCGPKEEAQGILVGGNLCVLASLAGTPWALQANNAIVLLEDITELPYRIDRLIHQLRYAGTFKKAKAIALGDFVQCEPPKGATYTLDEVLTDALTPLGIPVYARLSIGHDKRNLAVRIGDRARLSEAGLEQ